MQGKGVVPTSVIKVRAKREAAQSETSQAAPAPAPVRVQAYPGFEHDFAINPENDVDAETNWTLCKADEEAELRHANEPPAPPPQPLATSA